MKIRRRPLLQYAAQLRELSLFNRSSPGFISKQTGDSIKTLEADYAKYLAGADTTRDFVEDQIRKSGTQPKPAFDVEHFPTPVEKKSP